MTKVFFSIFKTKTNKTKLANGSITLASLLMMSCLLFAACVQNPSASSNPLAPRLGSTGNAIEILVDDFKPQRYQGDAIYYYNRLEGDRGALNDSVMEWGDGQVTMIITQGKTWGGEWMSLNHPIREGLGIDFSAILPAQIQGDYQCQITGITVVVAKGTQGRTFRLELKDGNNLLWKQEVKLTGREQALSFKLPALGNITQLVWVLDNAASGDSVVLKSISFQAQTRISDTATKSFVWSYAMLLDNWNPATGLARDKAKDASGEMDAIQATGSLAAATALAEHLRIIERVDAVGIVSTIGETLLNRLPRFHGLWPHWVTVDPSGMISLLEGTEWSSVDTVIAALGLLEAQQALGLDTAGAEQMLQGIDWNSLVTAKGISHGYSAAGELIPYAWDTFGGESWLVEMAYAAASGQVALLTYPAPPTANGSGFIDELAWLFVPQPEGKDHWGTDWNAYRSAAAGKQINFYTNFSGACFKQFGLFGLSASEVPDPSKVGKDEIYQAFGVGGQFAKVNFMAGPSGSAVVSPHYSAMIASIHPQESLKMWDWLIAEGHFSPLTNVESLSFSKNSGCTAEDLAWNQLKGSWNLALQTLGWGRYLEGARGEIPILWQAANQNQVINAGYQVLSQPGSAAAPVATPTALLPVFSQTPSAWRYERECENPDEATVGQAISRSNASALTVQGQFGANSSAGWPAQSGYVRYTNIKIPQDFELILMVRYSKNSPSTEPISIYLDNEVEPRASFHPADQGDWNSFTWTEPISLGNVQSGVHSLMLITYGQQFGVADLDKIILSGMPPRVETTPAANEGTAPTPTQNP